MTELCKLLTPDSLTPLAESYSEAGLDDGGMRLIVVRFPGSVKWIYAYGDSAPEVLNHVDALISELFTESDWTMWHGSDATWYRQCGWPPLEAWLGRRPTAYPPMWPD